MASNHLAEALGLVDRAEQELEKVRLETPADYMDTDQGRHDVTGRLRSIDDQYLEKAVVLLDGASDEDRDTFGQRFATVNRTLPDLAGEANEGRLPQSPNAPWPPHEWVVEDAMRADAADEEAEPALNGYDQPSEGGA
jgi:hypothetical protein